MSDARRGLPLLSEPPPTLVPPDSEIACRKCGKEFHVIFTRSRKCNHCGYSYCHSCSDFQALMPRSADTGYDPMHVCGFCIEYLTITAAGRNSLKAMPLGKLKRYVTSYDIKITRALEKDDIIDGIVAARGPNGCLSLANENFYRRYSVPNKVPSGRSRGFFSRSGQGTSSVPPRPPPRPTPGPTYEFPRPDLEPDYPPQSQPYTYQPPPGPPPPQPPRPHQYSPPRHPPPRPNSAYSHTPPPPHHHYPRQHPPPPTPDPGPSYSYGGSEGYQPGYGGHVPPTPPYMTRPQQSQPQSNYHSHSSPPRAAPYTSSAPPQPPPRPRAASSVAPPPNLDQLVEMTTHSIGSLSISALKSILFTNHVTTGQILEKGDLVNKVLVLVEDEKAERVRQRQMEGREEMERLQREMEGLGHFAQDSMAEQTEQQQHDGERDRHTSGSGPSFDTPTNRESKEYEDRSHDPSVPASPPHPTRSTFERPGMCVICQDEDANIAIIDCGHMAMCRGCSELVMTSSKECPLCRTRIVTEARLLRIFRT